MNLRKLSKEAGCGEGIQLMIKPLLLSPFLKEREISEFKHLKITEMGRP